MSAWQNIIGLVALVALSGYLYLKHRQRARAAIDRRVRTNLTGEPIDVSKLAPTVRQVRQDYLAARRPSGNVFSHRNLLGLLRRAVARLAYFHDRETEQPGHIHSH